MAAILQGASSRRSERGMAFATNDTKSSTRSSLPAPRPWILGGEIAGMGGRAFFTAFLFTGAATLRFFWDRAPICLVTISVREERIDLQRRQQRRGGDRPARRAAAA